MRDSGDRSVTNGAVVVKPRLETVLCHENDSRNILKQCGLS